MPGQRKDWPARHSLDGVLLCGRGRGSISGPPMAALHRCRRHPPPDKGLPQRLIPGHSPGGPWPRSFWPMRSCTVTAGDEGAVKTPGHPPLARQTASVSHVPSPHPGDQPASSRVRGPLRVAAAPATRRTPTDPRASCTRSTHAPRLSSVPAFSGRLPRLWGLGSYRKKDMDFLDEC